MKEHWTQRSIKDYIFKIGADFIAQLEEKMEMEGISQDVLANTLKVTKSRVSQVLNKPGNITLQNVIQYAGAVGIKVSIVAYDDDDPENAKGLINSDVFKICWEKLGKPNDFWAFRESLTPTLQDTASTQFNNVPNEKPYSADSMGFLLRTPTNQPELQIGA
jgi:transcriptional regulator with XRE-family HTH domain